MVTYSQHSIFFVTYESAQWVRLFHNTKLERLTCDKHSNLLAAGQFLNYEWNKVLLICEMIFNKEVKKTWKMTLFFTRMEQQTLKNVNNCLNMNIYSYLETSGGQSSNLYLNVVHFSNTSVNYTFVAA